MHNNSWKIWHGCNSLAGLQICNTFGHMVPDFSTKQSNTCYIQASEGELCRNKKKTQSLTKFGNILF